MSKENFIYKNKENQTNLLGFYDKAISKWPVVYENFMIKTRYGDTHVIASGPKDVLNPSIVLIHAAGINATMWSSNINAFSQLYRVYALDTIGDLGKSILKNKNYYPKSAQDYSIWLDDVLNGLGVTQAYVIGSSMGGWIAHGAAIFYPCSERIKKIVLIDPAAGIPEKTKWSGLFFIAAILPFKWNYQRVAKKILGKSNEKKEFWINYMVTAFESKVKPKLGLPSKFPDEELKKTKVPTLLLIGQEEVIYNNLNKTIERAKKFISGICIIIIPNAGHLPNIDQPEMVNKHILKFLNQ